MGIAHAQRVSRRSRETSVSCPCHGFCCSRGLTGRREWPSPRPGGNGGDIQTHVAPWTSRPARCETALGRDRLYYACHTSDRAGGRSRVRRGARVHVCPRTATWKGCCLFKVMSRPGDVKGPGGRGGHGGRTQRRCRPGLSTLWLPGPHGMKNCPGSHVAYTDTNGS